MRDPFQAWPVTAVAVAQLVLPVLLDRLGGSAVVTEGELDALSERYGGGVSVSRPRSARSSGGWRSSQRVLCHRSRRSPESAESFGSMTVSKSALAVREPDFWAGIGIPLDRW